MQMTTETLTEPTASEAPPSWPPLAHLVHPDNLPVRKGTIALCGARLMGVHLEDAAKVCKKCKEISREETA